MGAGEYLVIGLCLVPVLKIWADVKLLTQAVDGGPKSMVVKADIAVLVLH